MPNPIAPDLTRPPAVRTVASGSVSQARRTGQSSLMNLTRLATLTIATLSSLLGCSSMSGLDGEVRYACRAPAGAQCTSVSGVYANQVGDAAHATTASNRARSRSSGAETGTDAGPDPTRWASLWSAAPPRPEFRLNAGSLGEATRVANTASASPTLRSAPRVLKLWVAPWEDADGDLHEAATVHVLVDTGHWLVDRIQRPVGSIAERVRPPARVDAKPTPTPTPPVPAVAPENGAAPPGFPPAPADPDDAAP